MLFKSDLTDQRSSSVYVDQLQRVVLPVQCSNSSIRSTGKYVIFLLPKFCLCTVSTKNIIELKLRSPIPNSAVYVL